VKSLYTPVCSLPEPEDINAPTRNLDFHECLVHTRCGPAPDAKVGEEAQACDCILEAGWKVCKKPTPGGVTISGGGTMNNESTDQQ